MATFLVTLPEKSGYTLQKGVNAILVVAEDAADAKAMAKTQFSGDSNAAWESATATAIVVATDMEGWRLRVQVLAPAGGTVEADVTYTGIGSDVLDDMGTAVAILLNATANIANAGYTGVTQVLIAATGAGDGLGDHKLIVELYPPLPADTSEIPGFVASITDEGASNADISATLAADAHLVPGVPVLLKQA